MLTQLATVKTRLRVTDTDDDDLLTEFMTTAGAQIDRFCNRTFDRTEDALQEFPADMQDVIVSCYPIEIVSGFDVFEGQAKGWVPKTGYDFEIRDNCVIHLYGRLARGRQQARVWYTGGYVLPGTTVADGQTALPAEVEQACIEQVAWLYQAKDRLGIKAISGEGGTVTQFATLDLVPVAKMLLQKHRRLSLI